MTSDGTRGEAAWLSPEQEDEIQAENRSDAGREPVSASGSATPHPSPKKTVLVVEDDEAVSGLLVALLEDRGYAAVPAYDGRSAIELAGKLLPHLITLDLALPGTDGHEVLE